MKMLFRFCACPAVLFASVGCGSGGFAGATGPTGQDLTVNAATALGPHGGQAIPLANTPGAGYCEIIRETAGARGNGSRFAIFFLGDDLKSPIAAAPSNVSVKLTTSDGETNLSLTPNPAAGDSAGAGRFVSPPGPFDADEYRGMITCSINGESITRPFALR